MDFAFDALCKNTLSNSSSPRFPPMFSFQKFHIFVFYIRSVTCVNLIFVKGLKSASSSFVCNGYPVIPAHEFTFYLLHFGYLSFPFNISKLISPSDVFLCLKAFFSYPHSKEFSIQALDNIWICLNINTSQQIVSFPSQFSGLQ